MLQERYSAHELVAHPFCADAPSVHSPYRRLSASSPSHNSSSFRSFRKDSERSDGGGGTSGGRSRGRGGITDSEADESTDGGAYRERDESKNGGMPT